MKEVIGNILIIGLLYFIGCFIASTWDPLEWHWVLKLCLVIWVLALFNRTSN